jgi:Phage tail protein
VGVPGEERVSGLVVADHQYEFDGLLIGAGSPYGVTGAAGFLDLSGVRAAFTPRARAHGGYTEPHFGGGAVLDLTFDINATSATSFDAAVLALEAATYPQATTRPLWWQLPGHGLRTMQVQVVRRSIPIDVGYVAGLVQKAAIQFYAPDPLKYGVTQTLTTGLPTTSGGLPYNLAYPLAYGSTATGRITAQNAGSAVTSPVFTATGPQDAAGFQITSLEDGITLQYNGPLGAADQVVIDTHNGSVTLNGWPRSNLLSFAGIWPTIPAAVLFGPPGVRTFGFSTLGSFQAAASLSASWVPAFW